MSRFIQSPLLHLAVTLSSSASLFLLGYLLLLFGWWIPVFPAALVYFFNGEVLYSFYWYGQSLKFRIAERQRVIRQSYSAIHNGPLQTLAYALQLMQTDDYSHSLLKDELQRLDSELRDIHEFMERSVLVPEKQLYLTGNFAIDLNEPLHELLYQVYSNTLLRSLPCFADIEVHITQFKPMEESTLSAEHKQEVARFFEEALCNVGLHAKAATQLEITCAQIESQNVIRIIDNGKGLDKDNLSASIISGRGTKQAVEISRRLRGMFQRKPNHPEGIVCELLWPIKSSRSRFF